MLRALIALTLVLAPRAPAQDVTPRAVAPSTRDGLAAAIPLGPHAVGFFTALVEDAHDRYSQYGYDGAAPRFVQVWYPLAQPVDDAPLTYGELRERQVPEALEHVYAELLSRMDESLVTYDLSEQVSTCAPLDFTPHTTRDVLDALRDVPTASHRARPEGPLDVPMIVYHHGSQGTSDENVAMAEFLASRGWGFVSANFHLPYEDMPYGLHEGVTDDTRALHTLIAFARTLTESPDVVFIGHSWGAQVGWCHLDEPGLVQAFVSMETTIEPKTDLAEIADKWPFVHEAFTLRDQRLALPVLHFANTRVDAPFAYFAGRNTAETLDVSARAPFEHDAYTSAYFLRLLVRDRFPQPDTDLLQEQLALYAEHLRMIGAFLDAVGRHEPMDVAPFRETFFVHRAAPRAAAQER
ncbi:MAG: alpha/beta hydrolase [Planctomycetes bacterium]|nr:alpha/beta hydrolase [Planctomycetota bacterium]